MKKSSLLLLSAAALLGLTACDGNTTTPSSSVETPVSSLPNSLDASASLPVSESSATLPSTSSSSNGGGNVVTVKEALSRALAADYSNMTVYSGALANEFETGEYEAYYNDYQIVFDTEVTQYFHDYQGESYQYFKASAQGEVNSWLKEGYNGAKVGLGNMNSLDVRELIAGIKKYESKVQYMEGVFYIVNEAAVQEIVEEAYAWAYDVSVNTIFFTIDATTLTFSKIGGFDVDIDTDKNIVAAEIYQIGTTSWNGTLPEAPNANNVKEYWQYKGWSGPQVQVYPSALNITVDPEAIKNGDAYVLEIEEGVPFEISAEWDVPADVELARQVRHNSITYVSTNEDVAYVGYNDNYSRLIVGASAGDCEIYAVAEAPAGATPVESNHIKVHVNSLAEQNLEGAVYDLTFDGTIVNGNVAATNKLNNTKPFDITVNEGVEMLNGTESSPIFNGANVMVMRSSQQGTLNKEFPGDAVATFDFSDQQVSGISFYYGALFSNYYVGENYLTKIAIETSNDGQTWTEVADITDEVKEHNSPDNLHLMEKSFAPASKVRIHLYSNMIGTAYEMSLKGVAFIANDQCHSHYETPNTPVTSVTIAAANDATKVKMGKTLQINGSVTPNNASNKTIAWHVSDASVATISASGVLTPIKPGSVTIYATSAYGATDEEVKSNEITITVLPEDSVAIGLIGVWKEDAFNPNFFEVSATEVKIRFDGEAEFTLPYSGNDDDGYAIFGTYTDKNTAGYFKIKVSSSFSNQADYSYNLDVAGKNYKSNVYSQNETLAKYIEATSMSLSCSKSSLKIGDNGYISASFGPNGATAQAFKLEVADTSVIAFVGDEGAEVASTDIEEGSKSFKCKGSGSVVVTATSESGLTATITITVAAPKLVTSISVTLGNDTIAIGGTTQASITVNPSDADDKGVTWSSSKPAVATVSSNGKVTGKSAGTAEIIATAKDGSGIVGKATVTVSSEAPAASFPNELVGTSYESYDDVCYYPFTFSFISSTEFKVYSEVAEIDATFVLVSRDGDTYNMVNAEDSRNDLVLVVNSDGSICITIDGGNPWYDYFYFDNFDITAE
ncbi:MAG: Ig-like domain-containing protein [Bacilli bacterium]|nr:Ig-like domain-containing protein [Bacilli bacterium]